MDVQVNWLAVLLATASSMVVGSVWYAKGVFGGMWAKMVKLDEKKINSGSTKAILVTIVASLVTAYVLAHVTYLSNSFFQNSFMQDALVTAFWLWLGLTAARMVVHDAFEQRSFKLTCLNITHELATLLVMGLFIGWLKP